MSQYLTEARLLENVLWVKTIPLYKTSEARIKRLKELISQYDSPEKLQDVSVGEEIKANKSSAPVSEETFKQFHRLLESQIEACREQQEAAQVRNAERVREKTQESNLRAIRNRYEREIEAARRVAAEQQAALQLPWSAVAQTVVRTAPQLRSTFAANHPHPLPIDEHWRRPCYV